MPRPLCCCRQLGGVGFHMEGVSLCKVVTMRTTGFEVARVEGRKGGRTWACVCACAGGVRV